MAKKHISFWIEDKDLTKLSSKEKWERYEEAYFHEM